GVQLIEDRAGQAVTLTGAFFGVGVLELFLHHVEALNEGEPAVGLGGLGMLALGLEGLVELTPGVAVIWIST
ncbi:MAG: hypothetical protein WAM94_11725, partial [Chromatiaceae bacterium]